jgi:hypothetical protein
MRRLVTTQTPPNEIEATVEIAAWLAQGGLRARAIEPLAGDLSTRRYFRVRLADGGSALVVRYPVELAAAQRRFRVVSQLLAAAGVRVPKTLLDDPERGFALVEDLGPRTLYELGGGWERWPAELDSTLAAAAAIARLPVAEVEALGSPRLDAELLRRELEQTVQTLLVPHGLATAELADALDRLCERLASAPAVPCHRDLMARNLVALGDGGVALLDFQDLRLGPACYDLASLLNDSWFAPVELERELLERALPAAADRLDYRRAVAQRTLKAVGTFLAFAARGDRRHLPLVVPTLARALEALADLPETAALTRALARPIERAGAALSVC